MRGLSGLSDFFLRKAFKFVLKRNLGRYLASELDFNQLDVQLGQGTIELRQLLLNCTELTEQLNSPYWEITAGFIGGVKAKVPITTLTTDSCQVTVNEILLTVKPKTLRHPSVQCVSASSHLSASNMLPAEPDDQPMSQDIMTEGIMQIAGGIEGIVQQLQLQATHVTVRVELPSVSSASGPPSLVVLRLDSISYSGQSSPALDDAVKQSSGLTLIKQVSFEGLQVELFQDIADPVATAEGEHLMSQMRLAESQLAADLAGTGMPEFEREAVNVAPAKTELDSGSSTADDNRFVVICSSNGLGCSGHVTIQLNWRNLQQIHPQIAVDLELDPFQIQLHPHHLPLLNKVAQCLNEASQHAQHDGGKAGSGRESSAQQEPGFVAGARSYVESALLPNCEQLAQDVADAFSWNSATAPVPANSYHVPGAPDPAAYSNSDSIAFHDAQSMMGSMRTTFNSFLSATSASLGSSQQLPPASSVSHSQKPSETLAGPTNGRTSSQQQEGNPKLEQGGPLGWELRAQCSEASLVLWYPEEEDFARHQDFAASSEDQPRCCLELGDLSMRVKGSNDGAMLCDLSLHRLECAEHLPVSGLEAAPAAATLAEVTRVTDLLPPIPQGTRPVPSFTGVSPLPVMQSLYSSTLSQLASSSYMSTSSLHYVTNSNSGASQFAAASQPQSQVWPVFCAGSSARKADGVTPSLTLSAHLQPPQQTPTSITSSSSPATARQATAGRHAASSAAGSGTSATVVASMQLRPSTVWLSLPFLQRLQGFFQPLTVAPNDAEEAERSADDMSHTMSEQVSSGIDSILQDHRNLKGVGPNPVAKQENTSPLQVAVQAPHICVVILLPASRMGIGSIPGHGRSYMAIDLFAVAQSKAQKDAFSGSMLTLQNHPQKQPRGHGSNSAGSKPSDMWEGQLSIGRAKMYLIGSATEESQQIGIPNANLQAHCILEVLPEAEESASHGAQRAALIAQDSALRGHTGLSANVVLTPGRAASPHLVDMVWEATQEHGSSHQQGMSRGSHVDGAHMQEAAVAASGMRVHLRAPKIHAELCQADLAALLGLAGAINAWQNESRLASQQYESAEELTPMQVSMLLECGIELALKQNAKALPTGQDTRFGITAEDVRICNISSLGGKMDAGALRIHAEGVTLTGGQDRGCLLHCPGSASSPSTSSSVEGQDRGCVLHSPAGGVSSSPLGLQPAIEFWQVTRPFSLETSRLVQSKAGQTPTLADLEAISSVLIVGATFATDGGNLMLPWLTDLAGFFVMGGYEGAGNATPPDPPATSWSVALQDVALRYEPAEPNQTPQHAQRAQHAQHADSSKNSGSNLSQVSAVITLAGLLWQMHPGKEDQRILLQCLGLHCAESALRQGAWSSHHRKHIPGMQLANAGYSLVLQEKQLEIVLKPVAHSDDDFSQTHISNQRLNLALTKTQMRLLTSLVSQWTAKPNQAPSSSKNQSSSAGSSRQDPDLNQAHGDRSHGRQDSEAGVVEWHREGQGGSLKIMEGVQEDAFKRGQNMPAASVFLEGGWFPPEQLDLASSIIEVDPQADQAVLRMHSGSAPAVREDYVCPNLPSSEVSEDWEGEPSHEEKGVWFGDPNSPAGNAPTMHEDYVQLPSPGNQGTYGSATGSGALGALPPDYPTPQSRLICQNLKLLITLSQEENQHQLPGHAQQAEPNNGRLEVDLEGVCLQLDSFQPQGSPYAWRLAFSIHQLEVRDHVKKSGGKPPRWRRMLGYHFMARTPRDPAAVMFQMELEAVRPDGVSQSQQEEEYRLSVALLPLRLRIDQTMVAFLQSFFATSDTAATKEASADATAGTAVTDTVQESEGASPFLQKVEVQAFSIVIDYQPRRVDAAALRSGSFVEVLNLVPWGGVKLDLPQVKATGVQGLGALASAVGNVYLQDIATSQVHKFVVGVAPVRSLCRVGWAAKQLITIPADQLRSNSNNSSFTSSSSEVPLTRQLRRGVTTLARAITLEALGLGASVAGGADFVLRGGSGQGSEHPAGFKEGLKQAAMGLSSGFESAASALVYSPVKSVREGEGVATAVVRAIRNAPGAIAAPASAAAAATRVTLLGMRNALDPERYEERRR